MKRTKVGDLKVRHKPKSWFNKEVLYQGYGQCIAINLLVMSSVRDIKDAFKPTDTIFLHAMVPPCEDSLSER